MPALQAARSTKPAEVATLWQLEVAEIERRIWRLVRLLHVRSRELLIA
jgi:hypothetical protein